MRELVVVGATLALATTFTACGDDSPDAADIPSGAVAVVGDKEISQETFDRWAANTARTQGLAVVPDPPKFEKCAANIRKQPIPKGTPKPKPEAIVAQCQASWDQIRTGTMSFLIQAEASMQAAEELDLVVTAEDVRDKLLDYKGALKVSKMSEEDFIYQQRAQILQTEVGTQVQANADVDIDDEEAKDFYDEHKEEFQRPETRSGTLLTSDTKAKAAQAKKRLESGDDWTEVAQDLASKSAPVASPVQFSAGQTDKAGVAAFKAKKDVFTGPIRTETGWAVLQLTSITPSGTTPFDEAKATIVARLVSERETKAATDHQEAVREKTVCKEEYLVAQCSNMPQPEPAGTAPAEGE